MIYFLSLSIFTMTIDNLEDIRGEWAAISDQVMGGVSEVSFYEIEEKNIKFYILEGNVSSIMTDRSKMLK